MTALDGFRIIECPYMPPDMAIIVSGDLFVAPYESVAELARRIVVVKRLASDRPRVFQPATQVDPESVTYTVRFSRLFPSLPVVVA